MKEKILKGEKVMFKKPPRREIELELETNELLRIMAITDRTSEKYEDLLCKLERLEKLRDKKSKISGDAKATIAGNLLGIGLILGYERANILMSKAVGFVIKGRV